MTEIIDLFNAHPNLIYAILFFYSLGGGMIALLTAGILASSGLLEINIGICIVVSAAANFLGDEGLFYFSRLNHKQVLPHFRKHRRKLALSQILFRTHGAGIILAKKYIYGLKTLIPLAIGLTKFSALKFLVINAISAIIWALSLGALSYFAGDAVKYLSQYLGQNSATLILGFLLILALIWLYMTRVTKKEL